MAPWAFRIGWTVGCVGLLAPEAAAACTVLVDDLLSSGTTVAYRSGGTFVGDGWSPEGGTLVYDLPVSVPAGRLTFDLRGMEEAGLSQSDLAEAFTSWGGSFSDGVVDQFLQVKMAGDIYDGYDGRIKLQLGMEYGASGTGELGAWTGERDWHPGDWHHFEVAWGGGWAEMWVDGSSVVGVDYTPEAGGHIPFRSVRVPSDGGYATDPLNGDLVYSRVTICAEETGAPPSIDTFSISPTTLEVGQAATVTWAVSGDVGDVFVCATEVGVGTEICTTDLGAASGSLGVTTDALWPGLWDGWLKAVGPGGEARSGTVRLTLVEPGAGDDDSTPPSDDDSAPPADDDSTPATDDDSTPGSDDDVSTGDDDSLPVDDDDTSPDAGEPPAAEEWAPCGCGAGSGGRGGRGAGGGLVAVLVLAAAGTSRRRAGSERGRGAFPPEQ